MPQTVTWNSPAQAAFYRSLRLRAQDTKQEISKGVFLGVRLEYPPKKNPVKKMPQKSPEMVLLDF